MTPRTFHLLYLLWLTILWGLWRFGDISTLSYAGANAALAGYLVMLNIISESKRKLL